MQHLSQAYEGLAPDTVPYVNISDCLRTNHGHLYHDFVTFPANHGYEIDAKYRIIPVAANHHPASSQSCNMRRLNEDQFLQAWLFFGLIRCVVREELPIVRRRSLIGDDGRKLGDGQRLSTKPLTRAVGDWSRYLHALPRNSAAMRCIEAVQMLTLARRVIITNLADGNEAYGQNDERDLRSLCLMVLGETLSSALEVTMKSCHIDIHGWQLDQNGWGPPPYVLKQMSRLGWCPRLQEALTGQLVRSATLLYASFKLCAPQSETIQHHARLGCTKHQCRFIEACHDTRQLNTNDEYQPLHHQNCRPGAGREHCKLLGPNEERLMQIIQNAEGGMAGIPLLRYCGEGEHATVELEQWSKSPDVHFATVSHVWAHGLGNKTATMIWQCQLDHIRRLVVNVAKLEKSPPEKHPLFWLDTLAMPVVRSDDNGRSAALRQTAIDSIYHVFDKAKYGIIIDLHLLQHPASDDRFSIGVRLLSSGWIKRLWTLQEAFVTESLYIAGHQSGVRSIDNLWDHDRTEEDSLEEEIMERNVMEDSLESSIRLKLSRNIMEDQRRIRRRGEHDNGRSQRWSILITDAWNSAIYRDVGRLEHETLALASLLDLPVPQRPQQRIGNTLPARIMLLDKLMRAFWISISQQQGIRCAIPTGMIFTPGERVSLQGFGWAPRTWMAWEDEPYPYPLRTPNYTEELVERGLIVKYPGFLIHATAEKYSDILGTNMNKRSFEISVSAGLYDWYLARPLGLDNDATKRFIENLRSRIREKEMPQIAIILSRARPVEFPPEVALLVEIESQDEPVQSDESESPASLLYCRIIRRLEISRVSMLEEQWHHPTNSTDVLNWYKRFDTAVVAEALNDEQRWCVDGYIGHTDDDHDGEEEEEDEQYFSSQESPVESVSATNVGDSEGQQMGQEPNDQHRTFVAMLALNSLPNTRPEE